MYTTHGHHIDGSGDDELPPDRVARCGGPGLCSKCSIEAAGYSNDEDNSKLPKVGEDGIVEG